MKLERLYEERIFLHLEGNVEGSRKDQDEQKRGFLERGGLVNALAFSRRAKIGHVGLMSRATGVRGLRAMTADLRERDTSK